VTQHRRAVWILCGCAFLWGIAFPLNKMVLATISPMLFLSARFGLATLLLLPVLRQADRETWRAGLTLGVLFSVQLALFAAGLATIPPARSAFLFSVQTPLVPVVVLLMTRRSPPRRAVMGVAVAVFGSWLLTKPTGAVVGLTTGDLLTLASALLAALYVVAAGHVGRRHDPWRLLGVQFLVLTVFGLAVSPLVETARFAPTSTAAVLLPVLAVFSIMTFGGQLVGQRHVRATEAALIFAVEPVWAAAMSYLLYRETFGVTQWLGAALIVGAAFLVPTSTPIPEPATPPAPP
jgi:drug/metabolite transporter (DMT)-like permease